MFASLLLACGSSSEETASITPGGGAGVGGASPGGAGGQAMGGAAGKSGLAGQGGSAGSGGGMTKPEVCGDGLDNDGNGQIDNGCSCETGKTQPCFVGPAEAAGKGVCKMGTQSCVKTGSGDVTNTSWGACEGHGAPGSEVCGDGLDNNCDGQVDEGCCKPGEVVVCSNECGNGQQTCTGGKLSICKVTQPKPDAPSSCESSKCIDGESVACSNECGTGQQECDKGKLGPCTINQVKPDAPASCSGAECKAGEVVLCSNECGDGQQTCNGGKLTACKITVPKPGAPASCAEAECSEGEPVACQNACGVGVQQCVGGKLGPCSAPTPTDEVCDGKDNDCDGIIDEGCSCQDGDEQTCSTACGSAMQKCVGGFWGSCDAPLPSLEICDGLDNNCDGQIDENITQDCSTACGQGATKCIAGVFSACDAPQPSAEACDGLDNNCDGTIDEGCECIDGGVQACSTVCGAGSQTCVLGSWGPCSAPQPSTEVCDGLDNNCNGAPDDALTQPCSTACGQGVETCSGGTFSGCTAPQPSAEVCDGKDNNCNGTIDEGCDCIDGGVQACSTVCGAGSQACVLGSWGPCSAPQPSAEVCDGLDNNCNGQSDEGLGPTVAIAPVGAPLVCGTTVTQLTITFNEPVTGVVANDTVKVTGGATITGISGGPTVYTVSLGALSPNGSYSLSVSPGTGANKIKSACGATLGNTAQVNFSESNTAATLSISPSTFSFPATAVGASVQQTFTLSPGTGIVSNVSGRMLDTYTFAGGSYPGTGGTCGDTISAPCTVVLEFTPLQECSFQVPIQFKYDTCKSPKAVNLPLNGSTTSTSIPEASCPTTYQMYVSPAGSDASDGLTPATAKKTLTAALAGSDEGARILVAEGTYPETISIKGCRKVIGGYDATFTQRDPKTRTTALSVSVASSATISASSSGSAQIDGLSVTNAGASSKGVDIFSNNTLIRDSVIKATSQGVYSLSHACGVISDSVLEGGSAGLFASNANASVLRNQISSTVDGQGLNLSQCGKPLMLVQENVVVGADKGAQFVQSTLDFKKNVVTGANEGIRMWQNEGFFSDNKVQGSTNGITMWQNSWSFVRNEVQGGSGMGVLHWQDQDTILDGNRLSGPAGGLDSFQNDAVIHRNNFIFGDAFGVREGNRGTFVNNTIGSLTTAVDQRYGTLTNNLLFNPIGSGGAAISTWVGNASFPDSMENNVSVGFSLLLKDTLFNKNYPTSAEVNALNDGTKRVAGNASSPLAPSAVFVSMAGPDGKVSTLGDNDWHLLTSDPAITQGGKDASQSTCGTYLAPVSCGGNGLDADGSPRSVPYSVGASEK